MIILLFIPILAFSSIVKDDVLTTEKTHHTFKKVCSQMVSHETPLIEVVSGTVLDCMGKKISVSDFCEKEMAQDPYYIRAYVDRFSKKVVCHSGKKVILKYQLNRHSDRYLFTTTPQKGCALLKDKLAKRLDTVHTSFTKSEKGVKELNCYFESLPLTEKRQQI